MGKKPDELQREVALHREAISQRISYLEERLRSDASTLKDKATTMPSMPSLPFDIEGRVREHPTMYLAGALAAGVFLGMVSDRVKLADLEGLRREPPPPSYGRRSEEGLLAGLAGTLGGAVRSQLGEYLRQATAGFADEGERRRSEPAPRDGNGIGAYRS